MTDSPASEVAFITGGASGIGRATAQVLAERGAAIAVLDRSGTVAQEVASDIRAGGGRAVAVEGDVSQSADVARAVRSAVDALGQLTTVVACAGIDTVGAVDELDEAAWVECLAVNLTGVFLVGKYAVPSLLAAGGGSFVAISSAAGVRGLAGQPAYSASKHGVIGLIRTMALDYGGRGIRCNAVCPGFIETPMVAEYFAALAPEGERQMREDRIPAGRLGSPAEVAELVAHLTSDDASYTNGAVHLIDGGAYAGYWRPRAS